MLLSNILGIKQKIANWGPKYLKKISFCLVTYMQVIDINNSHLDKLIWRPRGGPQSFMIESTCKTAEMRPATAMA